MNRLVAALHDGHGRVILGDTARRTYPPLCWEWIEDRLVVTQVAPKGASSLKPGDVVVKVNGRPTADALAREEQLISGATPQWQRYIALADLAVGVKDSEIALERPAAVRSGPNRPRAPHAG